MSRLQVDGDVRMPRALAFDDLAALPGQIADVSTLVRGRVGGAVRLASILESVGAAPEATHVTLVSADGFEQSAPLAALGQAIVLYRKGDGPLPAEEGGPLRFLVPNAAECAAMGVDRCTNVKYLGRITVGRG
jgi:DMSO/TMAO reductase YedYZ molybdopterin-dependent catalytic subunit